MDNQFYKQSKKIHPTCRQLDDLERIKEGDIVWLNASRNMILSTQVPKKLLSGTSSALVLTKGFWTKDLTSFRACEIMDYIVKVMSTQMAPEEILKRKYSIWRKKLNLHPINPTLSPELPLP